jgi:hypothetical protein
MPRLLAANTSVGELELVAAASKLAMYPMLCTVFELLMMGGETA